MQIIKEFSWETMQEVTQLVTSANKVVALTGAGISVGSGIPDFRSPGGLWSTFSPEEFATLDVFMQYPEKAWQLYRALGKVLLGKQPNTAHHALSRLESGDFLSGIITQNVDNLHQKAGSSKVYEIHGDHQRLQCLQCGNITPVTPQHYDEALLPKCGNCDYPFKPNVVLFGEAVRHLESIFSLLVDCDLLLVIGTSAQVYPAASFPAMVRDSGGRVFEFNHAPSLSFPQASEPPDYFVKGDVCRTLPLFVDAVFSKA